MIVSGPMFLFEADKVGFTNMDVRLSIGSIIDGINTKQIVVPSLDSEKDPMRNCYVYLQENDDGTVPLRMMYVHEENVDKLDSEAFFSAKVPDIYKTWLT